MTLFLLVKLSTRSDGCLEWNIEPITLHNADLKCSSPNWEAIMNLLCHSYRFLPSTTLVALFGCLEIGFGIGFWIWIINIQLQLAIKAVLICTQRVINHKSKSRKSFGYHEAWSCSFYYEGRKRLFRDRRQSAEISDQRSVQFGSFLGQE